MLAQVPLPIDFFLQGVDREGEKWQLRATTRTTWQRVGWFITTVQRLGWASAGPVLQKRKLGADFRDA